MSLRHSLPLTFPPLATPLSVPPEVQALRGTLLDIEDRLELMQTRLDQAQPVEKQAVAPQAETGTPEEHDPVPEVRTGHEPEGAAEPKPENHLTDRERIETAYAVVREMVREEQALQAQREASAGPGELAAADLAPGATRVVLPTFQPLADLRPQLEAVVLAARQNHTATLRAMQELKELFHGQQRLIEPLARDVKMTQNWFQRQI